MSRTGRKMRDIDVRQAIRSHLSSLHAGDSSTRIVEEMGIWSGAVRIDVAVINGELSGYELKSDRDTLGRLPTQADYYGRVFDRLTLVVGQKHAVKAMTLLPKWWGVIVASGTDDKISLKQVRRGRTNPHRDPFLIAQLVWKNEALDILETHGLAQGWRSKPARIVHQRLAAELPFEALAAEVRAKLKARNEWLGQTIGDQGNMAI